MPQYSPGDRVEHTANGPGTVVECYSDLFYSVKYDEPIIDEIFGKMPNPAESMAAFMKPLTDDESA